jgi:hypothetical protein
VKGGKMPKKDDREIALAAVPSLKDKAVVPAPDSGFLGRFLEESENMLKARAMRMTGLMRRINESGQRTENLLRRAAEKMEATHSKLQKDFRKEGLIPQDDDADDANAEERAGNP